VPSRNDPAASLADILENLERIEGYVAGLDREAFGDQRCRYHRTDTRNRAQQGAEIFPDWIVSD
jgi:hypothetical protein